MKKKKKRSHWLIESPEVETSTPSFDNLEFILLLCRIWSHFDCNTQKLWQFWSIQFKKDFLVARCETEFIWIVLPYSVLCHHLNKRFSIGVFTIRTSDASEVTQHKINFVKNCPQWSLNPWPSDHQSHALPTELGRNLLEISEVSFLLFHAPLHMLDLVYF